MESCFDIEKLISLYDDNEKLKYLFFWGHRPNKDGSISKTCLSQWFDCSFTIDGFTYHTAEQYMMCQKAKLFDDEDIFKRILQANHPSEFKNLGRLVKNFNPTIWEKHRFQIVVDGNMAKFSQNPDLKEFLISTGDRVLVEASPYDKIWGIGLSANASNIENPHIWKGINLLGFALMKVREQLR
ncbi:MAG: NADAR family protein [Oscillospiraceae bacterium]